MPYFALLVEGKVLKNGEEQMGLLMFTSPKPHCGAKPNPDPK
jgi:hypothetical protein